MLKAVVKNIVSLFAAPGRLRRLLAILMLYAIFVAPFDIHQNLQYKTNCLICKFSQDLAGGKVSALWLFQAPVWLPADFIPEYAAIPPSKIASSPGCSRAPPDLFLCP